MAVPGEKEKIIDSETGSTRERKKGFIVLHLRGNPRERGQAHGRLLKEEILSSDIASYYGDFLKLIIFSRSLFRTLPESWRRSLFSMIENILYKPLENRISGDTGEELLGLSEATGIDQSLIHRAFLAPDIMQLLISGLFRSGRKGNGNYYLGGCSTAVAWGEALRERKGCLLARNLDFPGSIVWKYPLIVYHHPTESIEVPVKSDEGAWSIQKKVKQPYLYFSAAGYPGMGLTGLNRSGIAMCTHICISHESSGRRNPSLDYNHRIFTALESLEGLPHLVKHIGDKNAAPHVLVLADGKKAVTLEVSSKGAFIRETAPGFDTLVQTNHFLGPIMKRGEMSFALERESSQERYRFLRDALEMNHSRLDSRKMSHIISSAYNRFSSDIALTGSPSPSQPETLQSVVIEPESGNFWLAEGRPPGICFNRYCGFNSRKGLELSEFEDTAPDIRPAEWSVFNRRVKANPGREALMSLKYYTLAGEQMKTGREERAARLLSKAMSLYEDPGYFYTLAILYIRCDRHEEALELIDEIKGRFSYTPLRDSLIPLWEGRCHDLAGRRERALACYERGAALPGLLPEFSRAYRQGIHRKFTKEQLPVTINFNNPGTVKL